MAGDADLRSLLQELRSVIPANGGLGLVFPADCERVHYIGPRMKRIVDYTLMYRKPLRRIIEYEEQNPSCYFNDIEGRVPCPKSNSKETFHYWIKKRMPDYVIQKQTVARLKRRKMGLFSSEQGIVENLRERARQASLESKAAWTSLNQHVQDYQSVVASNQCTPSQLKAEQVTIEDLTRKFQTSELELRVMQSAYSSFKRFNQVENPALNQARQKRDEASAAWKEAQRRYDPWLLFKQELDRTYNKMTYEEEREYLYLRRVFATSSMARYFFADQLERVEIRVTGKLLDEVEQKHATGTTSKTDQRRKLEQECENLIAKARVSETKRLADERASMLDAKAEAVRLALEATRLNTGEDAVQGNLNEVEVLTEYDATSRAYNELYDWEGKLINDMADSDAEEDDRSPEDDGEAGAP